MTSLNPIHELHSPDWSVDPQINRVCCAEAGLCTDRAQDGSNRRDRTSQWFPGTAAGGRVCSLDRARLVTAGETAPQSRERLERNECATRPADRPGLSDLGK